MRIFDYDASRQSKTEYVQKFPVLKGVVKEKYQFFKNEMTYFKSQFELEKKDSTDIAQVAKKTKGRDGNLKNAGCDNLFKLIENVSMGYGFRYFYNGERKGKERWGIGSEVRTNILGM